MEWRKSSYSTGSGGQCVETASREGLVMVRDTANRGGVTLTVPACAWTAFTRSLPCH
jgi:hypothetical protein